MSKVPEHNESYKEQIRRYLNNEMSEEERHAFEKAGLSDDFSYEAMEGLENLTAEEYETDVDSLSARLHKRAKPSEEKKKVFPWIAVAASLLLLVVSGIFLLDLINFESNKQLSQREESEDMLTPTQAEESVSENTDSATFESDEEEKGGIALADEDAEVRDNNLNTELEEVILDEESESIKQEGLELNELNPKKPSGEAPSGQAPEEAMDEAVAKLDQAKQEGIAKGEELNAAEQLKSKSSKRLEEPRVLDYKKQAAPSARPEPLAESSDLTEAVASEPSSINISPPRGSRVVRGKVFLFESDEPLAGVNILIEGSATGTVTDVDGNFELLIPADTESLSVNFIGFQSTKVDIGALDYMEIYLEEDVTELSEVVVTGYGVEDEKDLLPPTMPYPEGGRIALNRYFRENMEYPEEARENNITGRVVVKFTVGLDGEPGDFSIVRSLGYGCDEEAIRLLREGPKWVPGETQGEAVAKEVRVSVRFRGE